MSDPYKLPIFAPRPFMTWFANRGARAAYWRNRYSREACARLTDRALLSMLENFYRHDYLEDCEPMPEVCLRNIQREIRQRMAH